MPNSNSKEEQNLERKRARKSSSEYEGDEVIEIRATEMKIILQRLEVLERKETQRDAVLKELRERVANLEKENSYLKKETLELKEAVIFNDKEREEVKERVKQSEIEQSKFVVKMTNGEMYSRRWNIIMYGIEESEREDCKKKVLEVIEKDLQLNTENMKFCGIHRLGRKQAHPTRGRPMIVRFTSREDRELVWKNKFKLQSVTGRRIFITDDVPVEIQEIRRKYLVPALKNRKSKNKESKVTIIGDKLVVDGKRYAYQQIPKRWFASEAEEHSVTKPNT